jgi:hypothetical protein
MGANPCEKEIMTRPTNSELKPGQLLDRPFLKEATLLEKLESNRYLIQWRDRDLIVVRHGRCEYRECRAMCCSMLCLKGPWTPYLSGFADQGIVSPVVPIPCRFLRQDLTCLRWKRPDFPENCGNFPVPGDPMYLEVMESCTFSFFLVRENIDIDALTS